ncbi:MAG: phage holin family protein [Acidimicrobiales bacterium]
MAKSNPLGEAQELQKMLVDYAKQETVEPLKTLGKYLGLGIAGAVCMFLGFFFLVLGVLRLVQAEGPDGTNGGGGLSLLPYGAAILTLVSLLALLAMLLNRAKNRVM